MRSLPTPPAPAAPRQLSTPFESGPLREMSRGERGAVLAGMARLLLEAADVAVEEVRHDER